MDATRFDRLTRIFTDASSRRDLLRGLAGAASVMAATQFPGSADTKKKHKKKRKKPQLNAYGCVDVGQACRGNDANCCSGLCEGNKPKKGKKDQSRCIGHDVGSCTAIQDVCTENGAASCGSAAWCYRTTGNAGFCGSLSSECTVCAKDTDCDAKGFGPGAACVFCTNGCPETNHTVCIGPAAL